MGSRSASIFIFAVIGIIGATIAGSITAAVASDIIDEWANVKTPAAPDVKAVTVDPKSTALIMGDLVNQLCGKRPRCVAALPAMKKLLGEARAAKATVIYSLPPNTTTADFITDVAPAADEPSVQSGVDKFFKTNLEQILKDKGIQTVIVVGTSAEGLVIYTGGGAALRGLNVVIPVDGMASVEAFAEQYVAWHMTHAPIISPKVTLTRTDMIKF
ncbi:MAG TPA: isochorismatase family protein [Candidatus Sulfotelmatobacter sp.]